MKTLQQLRADVERLEEIVSQLANVAGGAASGTSNTGYDAIVSGFAVIPNDNVMHTVASYDLTAAQVARYIEFQWLVHDTVANTMAARRQGAAFDATGGVGTVDNPVNIKTNMAQPPSFLFTTIGTLLVAQVSIPIAGQPANARAVIKVQALT